MAFRSIALRRGRRSILATLTGDAIPIEERSAKEVTHHGGKQLTPHGVGICNPAFDVTPAKYVTAIITERGVLRAPYSESLSEMEPGGQVVTNRARVEMWCFPALIRSGCANLLLCAALTLSVGALLGSMRLAGFP